MPQPFVPARPHVVNFLALATKPLVSDHVVVVLGAYIPSGNNANSGEGVLCRRLEELGVADGAHSNGDNCVY